MKVQFYTKEKNRKYGFILAPFTGVFENNSDALTWFHKYGEEKEKSRNRKLILAPAIEI